MKKFWIFNTAEDGECTLRLEGEIASESWWGDEVTPKMFMAELAAFAGRDITVWINSIGGDVVAASQIYTALKEHSGTVTVKVDGLAASAASVIAMAGDFVFMSPTSLLMIHDPLTIAWGNAEDFKQCIEVLNECKESIINAYVLKTGLSRAKIARLMSDETWMNAKKAVELGFADKVLYGDTGEPEDGTLTDSFLYGRRVVFNSLLAKFPKETPPPAATEPDDPPAEPEAEPPEAETGTAEIDAYKNQFEII